MSLLQNCPSFRGDWKCWFRNNLQRLHKVTFSYSKCLVYYKHQLLLPKNYLFTYFFIKVCTLKRILKYLLNYLVWTLRIIIVYIDAPVGERRRHNMAAILICLILCLLYNSYVFQFSLEVKKLNIFEYTSQWITMEYRHLSAFRCQLRHTSRVVLVLHIHHKAIHRSEYFVNISFIVLVLKKLKSIINKHCMPSCKLLNNNTWTCINFIFTKPMIWIDLVV